MNDNPHEDRRSDRAILLSIDRKLDKLMATDAEVLAALATLKTDLEAQVTAVNDEFAKLIAELPNEAEAEAALAAVNALDTTVKGIVVPTE